MNAAPRVRQLACSELAPPTGSCSGAHGIRGSQRVAVFGSTPLFAAVLAPRAETQKALTLNRRAG